MSLVTKIVTILSVAFVIFHVYTAWFGVLPGIGQKSVHLGFLMIIFYINAIADSKKVVNKIFLALMMLFAAAGIVYITVLDETLQARSGIVYTADIICGVLLIISIFICAKSNKSISPSPLTSPYITISYLLTSSPEELYVIRISPVPTNPSFSLPFLLSILE